MALKSKVVVITGGSQGLGKALAMACWGQGARVAIIGRHAHKLEQVEKAADGNLAGYPCDIRDPAAVRQSLGDIVERFGRIDSLVNNAGVYPLFRLEDATDDQLRSVIEINLLGAMYVSREAIPYLKKSRGEIINVSSEAVRFYPPMLSVYTASKTALEAFSQSLRVELAPAGIRVAALRVGHIEREDESPLDEKTLAVMHKVFEETGFSATTGKGMQQATVVATLLHMLSLPEDINYDLLEARSSR